MSTDWIHCNSCIALPSQNVQYVFSSCGHIICKKCIAKQGDASTCPYCKKTAKFIEINRTLKPDMQMLFRNPRDLASEYMKNLSTVLDFQHSHRGRLNRAQHEQQKKALKYVNAAQGEVKKRIEAEKKALAENKEIRCELEKTKTQMHKLEALLATRELELERLRSASSYCSPNDNPRQLYQRSDSGISESPMTSLSFIDAMTSTPINRSDGMSNGSRRKSKERLKEMFKSANGTIPSPIVRLDNMVTPALLGFNKKRSSSENNRRTTPNGTNFMFDNDDIDMAGGF